MYDKAILLRQVNTFLLFMMFNDVSNFPNDVRNIYKRNFLYLLPTTIQTRCEWTHFCLNIFITERECQKTLLVLAGKTKCSEFSTIYSQKVTMHRLSYSYFLPSDYSQFCPRNCQVSFHCQGLVRGNDDRKVGSFKNFLPLTATKAPHFRLKLNK